MTHDDHTSPSTITIIPRSRATRGARRQREPAPSRRSRRLVTVVIVASAVAAVAAGAAGCEGDRPEAPAFSEPRCPAEPGSRGPESEGRDGDPDPTDPAPPTSLDLGVVAAEPARPGLVPLDFVIAHERALDGGVAHLAELRFETRTGAHGRLELTTMPGRGAALALGFEDRLALSVIDGHAEVPARFAPQAPRLSLRRSHAATEVVAHIDPTSLREAGVDDHLAFSQAARELRGRLIDDPDACPGCAESLDRLGWTWLAVLRTACLEGLDPSARATCTADLWHGSPDGWW